LFEKGGEMEQQQVKCEDTLIWIDMEMTGLDPDVDVVLEIAVVTIDRTNTEMQPTQ